jgi:hypothetical protein
MVCNIVNALKRTKIDMSYCGMHVFMSLKNGDTTKVKKYGGKYEFWANPLVEINLAD